MPLVLHLPDRENIRIKNKAKEELWLSGKAYALHTEGSNFSSWHLLIEDAGKDHSVRETVELLLLTLVMGQKI